MQLLNYLGVSQLCNWNHYPFAIFSKADSGFSPAAWKQYLIIQIHLEPKCGDAQSMGMNWAKLRVKTNL